MKILETFPPNIQHIEMILGDVSIHRPVFTYGEVIHNPYKITITPDIEAHEEAHSKRQGTQPEVWWNLYLTSKEFRLEEEIVGYGTQMAFIKNMPHMNGKLLEWFKEKTAQALSSSLYGNLCTYGEAVSKIRNYGKASVEYEHFGGYKPSSEI